MATKKINVCDECLNEEFVTLEDGIIECKHCKTKYQYSVKKKAWEKVASQPDAKGFINETTS